MRKKSYVIAFTIFIAILVSSLITLTKAQPYYDAYFTSIMVTDGNSAIELINGGTAKVYDGQTVWVNLTFYNSNCGWPWGYLYTKIYIDDNLRGTSNERIVWLSTSDVDEWQYTAGSGTHHFKVEVWWESSGTHYLEGINEFDLKVVMLFVNNWAPASLDAEKGKTTASTWSITFDNGGNDMMYGSSISIVDSGGLQISPISANLGDIVSQGTKSTSFSVVAPSTLSIGSKSVSFQISYNDFRGTPHVESETAYVTVKELGTSITLTLNPSSVKKDGSTTITANLLDGNGEPIANQPIGFFIGTTSLGLINTDTSGNAVKSYTANIDAGTYVVNASYAGSVDFGSSSGTSNLIVSPFTTTLTIDAPSATQGKPVTLKATLKDENDNPIQGVSIQFQIYDGTTWSDIGSANTDSSGSASISYTPSNTGSFQVKAMFSGTTNYAQSSSTTGNLNVSMDYTPYYIGGGIVIVAIIGAMGYMVFRRRKKTTLPPQ